MSSAELEAIAVAGGEPAKKLVFELVAAVKELQEKVQQLEHRLNQTSKNSSKPPSSDRPLSRKARKALEGKKASERSPGGQPGHEGKTRQMAPAEDVDQYFEYLPECCNRCGESFTGSEEQVGSPLIHQKWELPEVEPIIYEHCQLRLCCPNCGEAQLAKLPEGMTTSAFGPRLEAHIAVLAGVYRLSRRQSAQIVEEVFGIPISIGAVDSVLMRTSDLLADPYLKLQKAIRQFVSLSERDGAPGRVGERLVKEADKVFALHRQYLEGKKSLKWLKQELTPVKERIYQLLDQGSRSRHKKTRRFCIDLLGDWDSLWLFSQTGGVPITNNAAERALRHSVIMRKLQFGTWSHKGNRWIERICSVRETCRLQDRSVLSYLTEVTTSAYNGQSPPSLVPP